jgi:tyrosyl-DNA phosphodiesterase-1
LSLQESNAPLSRAISISDSEDEGEGEGENHFQSELQRAIEASKAEASRSTSQSVHQSETPSQSARSTPVASFLSERAQMEKERLERLKRARGQDADDEGRSSTTAKRQHIFSSEVQADGRACTIASASSSSVSSGSSATRAANAFKRPIPTSEQLFWDGELRPTANKHSEPRQDEKPTFRLTEVLGPV